MIYFFENQRSNFLVWIFENDTLKLLQIIRKLGYVKFKDCKSFYKASDVLAFCKMKNYKKIADGDGYFIYRIV